MKKYTVLKDGTYKNNETGNVGIKPGNWMFEDVVAWLAEGNTPDFELNIAANDAALKDLREERNRRLSETDYMVLPDYFSNNLTDEQRTELVNYRQKLRDITKKFGSTDIVWPEKPDFIKD